MATIKRIVPSGQISDFRPSAPTAGGGFRLLADAFDTLYDRVLPIAVQEETEKGAALGRSIAKQQIGGEGYGAQMYASSSGSPGDPRYRDAIASIESAGSGDYAAIGPTHAKMGRALGRYQIMETNIGPWSKAALGREVSVDEFMANPAIQDAIFDHRFGGYVEQFGEAGAAQAWFAGPGGVGKTGRKDILGTSVGKYGEMFMKALGGTVSKSSSGSPEAAAAFAPTMLRDADGNLVSKLYNPSSDPIKQAFNLAAGADYQSQIFLKSTTDMMALREQFALDPDGFMQAAQSYVDGIVEKAPSLFAGDIRDGLGKEMQQVFLGIMDDRHRETRQRAANSNMALIEKWGDGLTAAIAGGDPKEIAAAQSQLSSALALRERLPGLAWTPEQSENIVRGAHERGQKEIESKQKEQSKAIVKEFGVAVDASKAGMTGEAEGKLLSDPSIAAAFPELVAELQAWVNFRDLGSTFDALPLDEQDQFVRMAMAQKPESKHEVEVAKALAARAKKNREAREKETRIEGTVAALNDSETQWNPYDSAQRKNVDEAYTALLNGEDPLSPEGQGTAADIAAKTGFVPSDMVDAIRSSLHSGDPAALASAMEFAGQVSRGFPTIFGRTTNGDEIMGALSDYRHYSRFMSAEEAAAMMVAADLPENVERRERMAPLVKEKVKGLSAEDIEGHFESRGVEVNVPQDDTGTILMDEYQKLFEDHFVATGNADLAKQRALEGISRAYGPTGIDGSTSLMRYPPTSFYPERDGSHDWMRDRLERDVTAFATGVEVGEDEDLRGWFGAVKDGVIDSSRIRIVSDNWTQDDVAAGRAPSYVVSFIDDDETWQMVPGRYRFDVPSQFAMDEEAFNKASKEHEEYSNLLMWREYLKNDPNNTLMDHEIFDMIEKDHEKYRAAPPPEGY